MPNDEELMVAYRKAYECLENGCEDCGLCESPDTCLQDAKRYYAAFYPLIRAEALEEAAKECERLARDAVTWTRHPEEEDHAFGKAYDWAAEAIRVLKGGG